MPMSGNISINLAFFYLVITKKCELLSYQNSLHSRTPPLQSKITPSYQQQFTSLQPILSCLHFAISNSVFLTTINSRRVRNKKSGEKIFLKQLYSSKFKKCKKKQKNFNLKLLKSGLNNFFSSNLCFSINEFNNAEKSHWGPETSIDQKV